LPDILSLRGLGTNHEGGQTDVPEEMGDKELDVGEDFPTTAACFVVDGDLAESKPLVIICPL
jgi:hypothetical protein